MIEAGVGPLEVQKILGHRSILTTATYAPLTAGTQHNAREVINALMCARPRGWATVFCPALMLFFLFRVTGIPMTEEQAVKSRGDDYRDYQRTTSVFVPWPPRA